jgi:hypothetical protein
VLHVGERFRSSVSWRRAALSLGFGLDGAVEMLVSAAMALFDRTTLFRIFVGARSHDS